MSDGDGLVCAFVLDQQGGGKAINLTQARRQAESVVWVHLDRAGAEGRQWLYESSGLDSFVGDALYGSSAMTTQQWIDQGHPRCVHYGAGVILNLRGVNLNPGADASDMVSVRAWFGPRLIVTVRHRHIKASEDIRSSIASGEGPAGPGDFAVMLAGRLVDRISDAQLNLQVAVDAIEQSVITNERSDLRQQLGALRRRAIAKRRHIVPQHNALIQLMDEQVSWLEEHHHARLRVIADRTSREVEELDTLRERAAVIQDEISNRLVSEANHNVYVLSIVAAIFLPLGFVTGLLGINLGGIPGRDWTWAFPIACVLLGFLALAQVLLFRRWKWF